ncbi:MAG: PEGA domain-containing protein [Methanomicrobiales archaeon]|nr:PEGA domain-containing protein [Methanomicrobiales archaeon]
MIPGTCSFPRTLVFILCGALLLAAPAAAFTANSFEVTVDKSGDAVAVFRFTLEGFIENAIPQSMLETELIKGFGTSSEPPELLSMDRSSATIRMKKFADTYDVPTGTEYRTCTMNFKKAEIALQESALNGVVTADFSPSTIKVTLPDGYSKSFDNADVLPSFSHIVVDPKKAAAAAAAQAGNGTGGQTAVAAAPAACTDCGAIKVLSSPEGSQLEIDGAVVGTSPETFRDIPAGSHTIRISKAGYEPISKTVTVKAGQTIQVSAFLSLSEPTPAQQAPGCAGIVAAISLILGLLVLRRHP